MQTGGLGVAHPTLHPTRSLPGRATWAGLSSPGLHFSSYSVTVTANLQRPVLGHIWGTGWLSPCLLSGTWSHSPGRGPPPPPAGDRDQPSAHAPFVLPASCRGGRGRVTTPLRCVLTCRKLTATQTILSCGNDPGFRPVETVVVYRSADDHGRGQCWHCGVPRDLATSRQLDRPAGFLTFELSTSLAVARSGRVRPPTDLPALV